MLLTVDKLDALACVRGCVRGGITYTYCWMTVIAPWNAAKFTCEGLLGVIRVIRVIGLGVIGAIGLRVIRGYWGVIGGYWGLLGVVGGNLGLLELLPAETTAPCCSGGRRADTARAQGKG